MAKGNLKVEQIKTESLIPYARNARTHSDAQVEQIAASVREFGFCNPVLVDADGGIIAGHGRVLAARKLKMSEVPCIRLGHLTDEQKRAYILADNKLAMNAGWNEGLLMAELEKLKQDSFDISLIGFDRNELSALAPVIDSVTEMSDIPIPAPEYTWVLIGCPTRHLGKIQKQIDQIAETPETQIEMAVSNGLTDQD